MAGRKSVLFEGGILEDGESYCLQSFISGNLSAKGFYRKRKEEQGKKARCWVGSFSLRPVSSFSFFSGWNITTYLNILRLVPIVLYPNILLFFKLNLTTTYVVCVSWWTELKTKEWCYTIWCYLKVTRCSGFWKSKKALFSREHLHHLGTACL